MTTSTYFVEARVTVEIAVDDEARDDFGGMLDPARQEGIYNLVHPREFLEHLAFNCAVNGIEDANRLDGWAGQPKGWLTMSVDRNSFDVDWIDPDVGP